MSAFKEISMRAKQLVVFTAICFAFCWLTLGKAQTPQQKAPARVYNTAKQKLKDGKQIVGATVFSPDPNMYCAIANAGYDFTRMNRNAEDPREAQNIFATSSNVGGLCWILIHMQSDSALS